MHAPKLLYIAHRRAGFSPTAFTARWRQHAALGMSQPRWTNVARYLHADRQDGLPPADNPVDCDGVAIVEFRSEAHRQHHIAQEASRLTMKADELETFDGPVGRTSLLTNERPVRAGPDGPFKLFVFWLAVGDSAGHGAQAADAFTSQWQARARQWKPPATAQDNVRFVQNVPVQPRAERSAGLACDGIDEFTAADAGTLKAHAEAWVRDADLHARPQMVLTRVVVLHDQPVAPAAS
ncbi:MAG: hypothetical protein EOP81_01370 [Variovorax sp.]|nr:MAG: hypothetical protein EOP81_01370 [Variovorax sp.]